MESGSVPRHSGSRARVLTHFTGAWVSDRERRVPHPRGWGRGQRGFRPGPFRQQPHPYSSTASGWGAAGMALAAARPEGSCSLVVVRPVEAPEWMTPGGRPHAGSGELRLSHSTDLRPSLCSPHFATASQTNRCAEGLVLGFCWLMKSPAGGPAQRERCLNAAWYFLGPPVLPFPYRFFKNIGSVLLSLNTFHLIPMQYGSSLC